MKHELLIRADGSTYLGLGHLVRSSSLAGYLSDMCDVTLVCREIPGILEKEFKESGFGVERIEREDDFFSRIRKESCVVLDGYSFLKPDYQKKVKETGAALACITDDAKGYYPADLVINHAPGLHKSDFEASETTRFALGPDYALLREPFIEKARAGRTLPGFSSVFICFGGSDYRNLTNRTVQVIRDFDPFENIFIITGSAFEHAIEFNVKQDSRLHHSESLTGREMADLMSRSDIAIVPASSILFEALAAGCRVVSGIYNENQYQNYRGFRALGAFADAGQFHSEEIVRAVKESKKRKPKKWIDGNSPQRFQKLFSELIHQFATKK